VSSTTPTESKPQALRQRHLKAVKLPTMLRECEKTAARCGKENADHPTFLLRLAEAELLERSSIVLATNMLFERWTEILGCERLTGATLDRITHRCHIIEASGSSYRPGQAKRRRAGRTADRSAGNGKPS